MLHSQFLARQEVQSLHDPADIAHVLALGRELTRLAIGPIYRQPTELFHYTPAQSCVKLIRAGVLRATNAEQCNDRNEVVHGRNRIRDCLEQKVISSFPRSRRWEFFLHFVRDLIFNVRPHYYVTCFSARENGRTEWGYADDGRGVVIAFDTKAVGQRSTPVGSREVAKLRPIVYRPDVQTEQLHVACDAAYRTVALRLAGDCRLQRYLPFFGSVSAMLCAHLTSQALAFKDDFWEDEREWRMVVSLYGDPSDVQALRETPDGRSYIELEFPDGKLPLTRILLGPLASQDDEAIIRATLQEERYDVAVTRSDAPFRPRS